ncbi:MAG TPA: ankyrin repeat domain-containing protein, partial [Armatimonadota bacterium]|nr:ankyrin repeat domain-containing protein [Armatimonadota bacterium]
MSCLRGIAASLGPSESRELGAMDGVSPRATRLSSSGRMGAMSAGPDGPEAKELAANSAAMTDEERGGRWMTKRKAVALVLGAILIVAALGAVSAGVVRKWNVSRGAYDEDLRKAAFEGHVPEVAALLNMGVDVAASSRDGETPLYFAAHDGHLDMVRYLVEQGADVNAGDHDGVAALHLAAGREHVDMVRYLAVQGADVNVVDDYGWTPLYIAVLNGDLDAVEYLVAQGAGVNTICDDGDTPLSAATTGEIRALLIEHGAKFKE